MVSCPDTYPLSDPGILGQLYDRFHILVRQRRDRHLVVFLGDVIGLYDGREHRETVRRVQRAVVVVVVDPRQLLQFSSKVGLPSNRIQIQ